MKKLKQLKQSEVRLLFLLLITIIVVVSVRFGYAKKMEMADVLEEENITLQNELSQYQAMQQDETSYREGLEKFTIELASILNAYGPGTSPEKTTDYLIGLEEGTGANIYTVSFGTPEIFFDSSNARNEENGIYEARKTQMSLSYKADYNEFKQMVDYIQQYDERITIDSISIAFDQETGDLSGSLVINWFSLTGTGKTYEDPTTEDVGTGKSNIFDTSH